MANALGGLIAILQSASPEDRAAVYQELCVRLDYDPHAHQVRATADLARVAGRVGGGTWPCTPRGTVFSLAA